MREQRRVVVGRVSGVFGVRGWVRVRSHTEPAERLLDYSPWLLEGAGEPRRLAPEQGRPHGEGLVAKLAGIDDRDQAMALVGADISVAREQLPALAEGEYYWVDLIGLEVVNREGRSLGRVADLMATGANDVLRVTGERERLIPFVTHDVVLAVDLAAGRIDVDWDPDF
ncbi:MAG: ribosome maturation factor RimM [Gammaproteobacteria bacterium]|nr:ribosome maturation factor RimM [Gammaproteobacteria bacterium]